MIVGIGTDSVLIDRVRTLTLRWGERFPARVLGPNEMQEYRRRSSRQPAGAENATRYLARRFAAKEAIGKALGVGLYHPMSLHSVEILNDPRGAPRPHARKALAPYLAQHGIRLHVSLSDELGHAQALAIAERA
jgi:holo-[acyl-carrier protein] synthase